MSNHKVICESMTQFKFVLKNGQSFIIDQDEAEQIRDYLNEKIPKINFSTQIYKNIIEKPVILKSDSKEDSLKGFTEIFKTTSEEKDGIPRIDNIFFKDASGNWLVEILKNGIRDERFLMGKISDSDSPLGKALDAMPFNIPISTIWLKKKRIQNNPRRRKAIISILEHEKYLIARKNPTDQRRRIYLRIPKDKTNGAEVENNQRSLISSTP